MPVAKRVYIPDTLEAVIGSIEREAMLGMQHPAIVELAIQIASFVPDRDVLTPRAHAVAEVAAVHDWCVHNIRYRHDPWMLDTTRDIDALFRHRCGDCDCHTILVSALLMALGRGVTLWLAGTDAPEHVYPAAVIGETEIACDATLKRYPVGAVSKHPNHWRVRGIFIRTPMEFALEAIEQQRQQSQPTEVKP
ncbi:MAG: hypothetical protein ABIH03_00215 [Pseudomonadota bacterium]